MDEVKLRKQLRTRIHTRRADIEQFLQHARPRCNVLNNVTIVCSALAAAFTAVPAVGGPKGTAAAAEALRLAGPGKLWQPLCVAAFVVAVLAAIAANLNRTHDLPAQVQAAEACSTELENLLTSLEFRELPMPEAVELYQHYNSKIPFVHEYPPVKRSSPPASGIRG
jgi:hypothetical protein